MRLIKSGSTAAIAIPPIKDGLGNLVAPDANPVLKMLDSAGTDIDVEGDGNVAWTSISTGRYKAVVTAHVTEMPIGIYDAYVTALVGGVAVDVDIGQIQVVADLTASDLLVEQRGTAQGGAAGSITLAASATFGADNRPRGLAVAIVGGTGLGQVRIISGWVESTKVASVGANWVTTPNATSVYVVFRLPGVVVADAVLDATTASHAIAGSIGEAIAMNANPFDVTGEGSHTYGDLIRLMVAVLAGKVSNFTTNTLAFKALDGTTTRVTVTKDATGRTVVTIGTLT